MDNKRDIIALLGFARFVIHQNHQDLVRILHVFCNFTPKRNACIANVTIVQNKIQFTAAKVKFKPRHFILKGSVVKYNNLTFFIHSDFDIEGMRSINTCDEVSQISYGGAVRFVLHCVCHQT